MFQDLSGGKYLLEFLSESDAEAVIEEGFDVSDAHITCHPPHARVTNANIMGLPSYIDDIVYLKMGRSKERSYL